MKRRGSIFLIVLVTFIHDLLGEGFSAGTLVKKSDLSVPIEEIRVGDAIDCWDFSGFQTTGKVTALKNHKSSILIRLILENETIICDQDQLFCLSDNLNWQQAQALVPGDRLKSRSGKDVLLVRVEPLNEARTVYEITVENEHNFYVAGSEVLTHNMVMIVAAAPAVAPVISGAVVVTAAKTAAAVGFIAGCIYSLFWSSDSKSKCEQPASDGGQNNRCKCGHYCGVGCGCECTSCGCGNGNNKFSKNQYTYEYGKYEDAGYHHKNSKGSGCGGKSPAPKDGQKALDRSFQVKPSSSRRIGTSEGQFVILDRTSTGTFHGHVRTWEEISSDANFDAVITKMTRAGFINNKGQILK